MESIEPVPTREYIETISKLSTSGFSLSSIEYDKKLIILNHFMHVINLNSGMGFSFDRFEDGVSIYHSKCIFDNIPDNPKQVTAYSIW